MAPSSIEFEATLVDTRVSVLAIVKRQVYSSDTVQIRVNLSSRRQFIAATQFSLRPGELRYDNRLESHPQFFDQFLTTPSDPSDIQKKEKYEANAPARPRLR